MIYIFSQLWSHYLRNCQKRSILIVLLLKLVSSSTDNITCEEIRHADKSGINLQKECLMTKTTEIISRGYTFATPSDEAVESIVFAYNKMIKYLPEKIQETFPNLKIVDAASCAIRSIWMENFMHLQKLSKIFLDGNQIERIERNTFEGLSSLTEIYLSMFFIEYSNWWLNNLYFIQAYNDIKFIDISAFDGLNRLRRVDLYHNCCIDKDFNTEEKLRSFSQEASENCQNISSLNNCLIKCDGK